MTQTTGDGNPAPWGLRQAQKKGRANNEHERKAENPSGNHPGKRPQTAGMEERGQGGMTGRDAAEYILLNRADDVKLIINIDGRDIPVYDMVLEPSRTALIILPDDGTDE